MKSQQIHQQTRKPIAAFEITAIPVTQKENRVTDLMACLKTILKKSHGTYDFAIEVLYLGSKSSRRINGSQSHIILTLFAYGEGQWGRNVLDMLDKRVELLSIVLRENDYILRELQPVQLEEIHVRLLTFQYKNILAPRRGIADVGHPVCALAASIPADTAVSLLFTRDLNPDCSRVSTVVMAQTKEALLCAKPHFQTWPMLSLSKKGRGSYLQKRLCDAISLNNCKFIDKAIPWNSSARLLELPAGGSYGMSCAAPSAIDVQFPEGMLNSRPQKDTVRIGYVENGKVAVSLTKEQLNRHCCVLGQTGSGKSTLLCQLIENCVRADMRVMVLDLAGSMEFRAVLQAIHGDIYTLHDSTSPFAINPFIIEGFSPQEMKSVLSDFFEKYLGLFEPLPRLMKDVFAALPERNYTVPEFIAEFMRIFNGQLGYSAELQANLRSSMEVRLRSFENLFGDARSPFKPADFFRTHHLLELHQCSEMDRTVFLGLILNVLLKYVQKKRESKIGLVRSPS